MGLLCMSPFFQVPSSSINRPFLPSRPENIDRGTKSPAVTPLTLHFLSLFPVHLNGQLFPITTGISSALLFSPWQALISWNISLPAFQVSLLSIVIFIYLENIFHELFVLHCLLSFFTNLYKSLIPLWRSSLLTFMIDFSFLFYSAFCCLPFRFVCPLTHSSSTHEFSGAYLFKFNYQHLIAHISYGNLISLYYTKKLLCIFKF